MGWKRKAVGLKVFLPLERRKELTADSIWFLGYHIWIQVVAGMDLSMSLETDSVVM
jgi:hypothetical protein